MLIIDEVVVGDELMSRNTMDSDGLRSYVDTLGSPRLNCVGLKEKVLNQQANLLHMRYGSARDMYNMRL